MKVGQKMKKKYLIGLAVLVSSFILVFLKDSVSASAQENNVEPNTESLVIYDRYGEEVELSPSPGISVLGTQIPTSIKKLKHGESYQSNEFSGSGTRYSGYAFQIEGIDHATLTFKKGGFAFSMYNYVTGEDMGWANLPLDKSPYTIVGVKQKRFYFIVDNPNKGQTYNVRAGS